MCVCVWMQLYEAMLAIYFIKTPKQTKKYRKKERKEQPMYNSIMMRDVGYLRRA